MKTNDEIKNFRQECNKRMEELKLDNNLKMNIQEVLQMDTENINLLQQNESNDSISTIKTSRIKKTLNKDYNIDTARTMTSCISMNSLTNEIEKYDKINNLKNKLRSKDKNQVNNSLNISIDADTYEELRKGLKGENELNTSVSNSEKIKALKEKISNKNK